MTYNLPATGTRIGHNGFLGTVRYAGPVDGTSGVWLGVEWDDPARGKHDGVKDGKRYFTCLVPNSGSFIRPTASISYGVTFLSALTAKYIDLPRGADSSERVILGSSDGAIEVEAVGLDKIRANLSRLDRLREVSLDNELVSKADPPGEIGRTCPGIRGLDLSKNLISCWDTVAAITVELENLQSLSLNDNRFRPPESSALNYTAFQRLEELRLTATLTTWNEVQVLLPSMPVLRTVELGCNRLHTLTPEAQATTEWRKNTTLQDVNLDDNEVDSFTDINTAMHNLSALRRLILTSNRIAHVPPRSPIDTTSEYPGHPLLGLKHLALAFNRLATWSDIDMIQCWCPELESLTLAGNPLIDNPSHATFARAFIIAKIPTLKSLDGAAISPRERTDCELLYLSHIAKQSFASDTERRAAHPQWQTLCTKHGMSDRPAEPETPDTLSSRLINIHIYHHPTAPPSSLPEDALDAYLRQRKSETTLRVLSTMTLRTLRMKLIKSLKVPKARQGAVRIWMVLPYGHFAEIDDEYATRDLGYIGVEEGTRFILVDDS